MGESEEGLATGVGAEISAVMLCASSAHEVEVAAITGGTGERGTRRCTGLPTALPLLDARAPTVGIAWPAGAGARTGWLEESV